MVKKLDNIKNIMLKHNCDGYIITNNSDILYLTGLRSSNIMVLITNKESYVLSDARYKFLIERQNVYKPVCIIKPIVESITDLCCELDLKKVMIDPNCINHKNYCSISEKINLYDLCDITKDLRMIKTNDEIENIKMAQLISEKAFTYVIKNIKEGMTTKEIAALLDYRMSKEGSEEPAFSTIVVNEEESADCHGVPSYKVIKKGDVLLFDFGATYNGYRSDMTRTVFVGEISEEKEKIYNIVLNAHIESAKMLKPGVKCNVIGKKPVEVFKDYGYEENFLHSLGHGVGIDIHEFPTLNLKCETELQEGMVVTIEPGLYFKNKFGIRIEDTYIITKNGHESIANLEKTPIII